MAIGFICSCCGERGERPLPGTSADLALICAPCTETPAAAAPDMSVHTIPVETSVVCLAAAAAFEGLTPKERAYALAIGRASWEGAKICLLQCSAESAPIFSLLQLVFSAQPIDELLTAAKAKGLTEDEASLAMIYVAAFYGNLGNYKSFGDTKFVPGLPVERLELLLTAGAAPADTVGGLWAACAERMYSLPPRQRQLGLGASQGVTTYFSANCDEADAAIGAKFLEKLGLSPYNTRLFKAADGSYTLKIASAACGAGDDPVGRLCTEHAFAHDGAEYSFTVVRGDHAALMARVVASLREAQVLAANEQQAKMMAAMVSSFQLGSIEDHMQASRHWIKDKGPAVESYIGFIESYRDPSGMRGEWEGFVSCVNKETSRKFGRLVDGAEALLALFPWPKMLEKDTFFRPDFTSLEVLAFGSSGVPAGINIPNYDTVRQNDGFKNVSLGNVLQASYGASDKPVGFVREADQHLFKTLKGEAFEVQVGVHELLGHGSGKLFHQGTADAERLVAEQAPHPLTGEPITGPFYAAGGTWDSTFGKLASSYEECRAECAGIFLCLEPQVLEVFGHAEAAAAAAATEAGGVHDVAYINWLLMVRAGLCGLEFYTPETGGWRQAHMRARYVILRVLLAAGGGLVRLERTTADDGKADVVVVVERALIPTVGKAAIGRFLLELQTHKSLGDVAQATTLFEGFSEVTPEMAELREIVMARKEPRKLLVQPHMHAVDTGGVALREFAESPQGMVESFVARFPAEDPELLALHREQAPHVSD